MIMDGKEQVEIICDYILKTYKSFLIGDAQKPRDSNQSALSHRAIIGSESFC